MIERMHHDMGGLPAGRVERTEHDYADWERRVDAINTLCRFKKVFTVDEMRKHIELLPPQEYDTMGYYDKWVVAAAQALIHRGVITSEELGRKLEEVERRVHQGKGA